MESNDSAAYAVTAKMSLKRHRRYATASYNFTAA
jgi:hypothetical protein